jgi:hypothetical protein
MRLKPTIKSSPSPWGCFQLRPGARCANAVFPIIIETSAPANNSFTGNASTDFGIKVAHYANAKPIAQTVVMLDLLAMVDIDQPTRIFMEWWDQPVMAVQAGNSRIRDRLIRAMTQG